MIVRLKGKPIESTMEKDSLKVVVDVQGVGYEVLTTLSNEPKIRLGYESVFYIRESVTAFDGATTLYGFLDRDEYDLFMKLRDNVDGMGPKKALESLDKISKSLPDFKRAVIDEDLQMLTSIFGFTKKMAEKLSFALKGKLDGVSLKGSTKWSPSPQRSEEMEAISGLVNLGYSEVEARDVVLGVKSKLGQKATMESILQEALRNIGAKFS